MQRRLRQSSLKLIAIFFLALAAVVAQDPTSFLTPDVTRVGERLACRCGTCRNSVATCPMLRCDFSDPMRRRIFQMKRAGMSDDAVVNTMVREQGVVALSSPPATSLGGLLTWIMPAVVLLIGIFVYSLYVRRNRKNPEPLSSFDRAMIDRFQDQIERELDEPPATSATRK